MLQYGDVIMALKASFFMVMTGKRESAARELLDKQNMNTLVQKCVFGYQETCN